MDNRKEKENKHKNNQNSNINNKDNKNTNNKNNNKEKKDNIVRIDKANVKQSSKEIPKESAKKNLKENTEEVAANKTKQEDMQTDKQSAPEKEAADASTEHIKGIAVNAAKVVLPIAACVMVIAVIISYAGSQKSQTVDDVSVDLEENSSAVSLATLSEEPLSENAHTNINDLMNTFYTALANGDMDTVKSIKDYNSDREIITYEKKSEFIESYDNVNCYTKPGVEENSYFVYVTYDVKIKDIGTEAPGLNAFYVYPSEDGSLKIDGDTEESIKAAFKLVTNQDDVVDLYNKIDVSYKEAIASDEALDQFMTELPEMLKESVGVALAQLETQNENGEPPQTETEPEETQPVSTEAPVEDEELPQNKTVNEIVRTTDTVNVRSSDSEEADRIGKAQEGTELTRIEDRVNGWSKVIFEDREAFIKSDYLEVVSTEAPVPAAPEASPVTGVITAKTNVNVRRAASQDSEKIGTASGGDSYELVEDQGEWYKINFNGATGFVKAEFFE